MATDALVVDTAPKLRVVPGVRDRDLLTDVRVQSGTLQLPGVDVEPLDVIEELFGVVNDAAHRGDVAVPRRQRRHAAPHIPNKVVQLGEFGWAGQRTSFGVVVSAWSSLTEVDVDRYLRMLAIVDLPYQLAAALAISYAGNEL